MNEDMFAFGNLLVEYRKKLKVRIPTIAKFLGQTSETIREWEECVSFPALSQLRKIASAYEGELPELKRTLEISLAHVREMHRRGLEAQKPLKVKVCKDAWGFIPSTTCGHRRGARVMT